MNLGIFVVWTGSGFYILVFFLKYFPNLSPQEIKGFVSAIFWVPSESQVQNHVNKDKYETQFNILLWWTDFVNEFVYSLHQFISKESLTELKFSRLNPNMFFIRTKIQLGTSRFNFLKISSDRVNTAYIAT